MCTAISKFTANLHSSLGLVMGEAYFTVYQTDSAIELHPGCSGDEQFRVICTCVYYQQACEIARLVGSIHQLPIRDLVTSNEVIDSPNSNVVKYIEPFRQADACL